MPKEIMPRKAKDRKQWLLCAGEFFEEGVDSLVEGLFADVAVANNAFVVQNVDSGPAFDIPGFGDGAAGGAAVPPGTPGDILLFYGLAETVFRIAVDAKERERLA